jgi:eukaryotic-like serine/threonine-protein kinase
MSLKGIIHRDLKPENILLNSRKDGIYDIRVADYGFAAMFDVNNALFESTCDKYVCGTAGYIAPEAFEGKGYSPKSDVFSVGSILFSLLTQKNLFSGRDYN